MMLSPRSAAIALEKLVAETGTLRRHLGLPDVGKRLFETKLDTCNLCNLQCKQCGVHLVRDVINPMPMSTELLQRVADEVFPYCNDLCLGSLAEPLLSPLVDRALDLGRSAGVPFRQMVSNALLLDERRARKLIEVQLDRFSVSADAASPRTYARIRGGDLGRLARNVARLRDLKVRLGSTRPQIRFNFVVLNSNLDEVPAMVDFAHGLGAERVDFSLPVLERRLDMEDELPTRDRARFEAIMGEARSRLESLGLPTSRLPVLPPPRDQAPQVRAVHPPNPDGTPLCLAPWSFMVVGWAGDVLPCCSPFMLGTPALYLLGEYTFAQILTGPGHAEVRRTLVSGRLLEACARCKAYDPLSICELNEGCYLDLGPRLPRAGT